MSTKVLAAVLTVCLCVTILAAATLLRDDSDGCEHPRGATSYFPGEC